MYGGGQVVVGFTGRLTTTLVYRTGCALLTIEVTVSSITKCQQLEEK